MDRSMSRRCLRGLVVFALCVAPTACGIAGAQTPSAEEVTRKAGLLLASGDYEAAARLIDGAQAENPTLDSSTDLHFLRGVAWQQAAARLTKGEQQLQALESARSAYRRALAIDPRSGPALNNLAALAAESNDEPMARDLYAKAIATGGVRQGFYALNYAKYLGTRDPAAAIEAASLAMRTAPTSIEARKYLGALYARHSPAELLPYARRLLDEGHTALATELALANLRTDARPSGDRTASLILLAATITREPAALPAFPKSDTAASLRTLTGDPVVGRGTQQLLSMFETPALGRSQLDWWWDQREVVKSIRVSGRGACRGLLRALGETYLQTSPARSQTYLRAAIELGDRGPDPDAFLRLVELHASQGNRGGLKELMDRYEVDLFTEKGDAYARGDWPLIYRLHVALGMTYAHLKIWHNGPVQNAIFQLSAAQKAADRLNEAAAREGRSGRTALPPVAVQQLAEGYEAIGRLEVAARLKIDAASRYQQLKRAADTAEMLRTVTASDLARVDPASRSKYQQLRRLIEPP